ncbi:hypothetical protein RclHR1_01920007 [Rhizophagus clarus]|uniref:UBC core domain-containing protein n=1 Tax=Rhizophagus clarus TaxID=94130 RepID=A0A2Z6QNA3_9GLOM|nr:hypothetical protein RclHR1_01920007 [Rhizophagus clarus]
MSIETKTSFARTTGSGSNREENIDDERSPDGENKPKPQFRDECFRKMDLMIEFTNLRNPNHCPNGVYVMPSADNFHKRPPAVKFIFNLINNNDGLFHPLVDPNTGSFSLSQQFKDWAPHKYYIFHVLHYIKKSFKKGVLDNLLEKHCPNKQAFTAYHNEPRKFAVLAKQCADLSISQTVLYDNNIEANPIQFSILPDEKLEELKEFIKPSTPERERPPYSSRRTYSASSTITPSSLT